MFLEICVSSVVISISFLLRNFTSTNVRIDCILLILFSSTCHNNPDVICLNSSFKEFIVIKIAILSQISLSELIATLYLFMSIRNLERILVINLSNLFDLLIFEYVRISWSIKYTTPILIGENTAPSFSHIHDRFFLLMMLLNKLSLTLFWMISVGMPIAIPFSFF